MAGQLRDSPDVQRIVRRRRDAVRREQVHAQSEKGAVRPVG